MFKALIPGAFGLAIIAMVFWLTLNNNPAATQDQNLDAAFVSQNGSAGACMGMIQNTASMPRPGAKETMSGTGVAMNMSVRPAAETILQERGLAQDRANILLALPIEQEIRDLSAKIDLLTRMIDQIATGKTLGSAATRDYTKGKVTKIDVARRELTINHEELKSLSMPAMIMAFAIADEAMLRKVKVGQSVDFVAERIDGRIVILEIR